MASKRELKRDINRLTFELVSDAFQVIKQKPEIPRDDVMKLINQGVGLRNTFIQRVNHPSNESGSAALREEYRSLRGEMNTEFEKSFFTLSQLVKPGK